MARQSLVMPNGCGSRRYRAENFNIGALSWWHLCLGYAIRYIRAKRECELRTNALCARCRVRFSPQVTTTKKHHPNRVVCRGDSWENRTPVSALRGPCLSRLTNEPFLFRSIILSQLAFFVKSFFESFRQSFSFK